MDYSIAIRDMDRTSFPTPRVAVWLALTLALIALTAGAV